MRLRIVTAGVGIQWESALVQACQDGAARAIVIQRCYDAGDLLAVAASGKAEAALVASAMRWLDRESVVRLGSAGLAIVGVVPPGDEGAERRLRQLGINHVAQGNARPATLIEYARAAIAGRTEQRHSRPVDARFGQADQPAAPDLDTGRWPATNSTEKQSPPVEADGRSQSVPTRAEPTRSEAAVEADGSAAAPPDGAEGGNALVVVWGPKGAPGRTTIAVNLAFEALPIAGETLLVDGDTYGGSVSQMLGFLEEHPGLAWAARLASRGELDGPRLWQATRRAGPGGPRVLSGLPRADLWTEIRPGTWESLLELFRLSFQLTVVDVGFCLEEEEELLYDHVRFRRNAATRLALQQADLVVAVARADPVGLHDFIRGYQQLREIGIDPRCVRVVVNQVRGGLFGGDAVSQIRAALSRYLGLEPSVFVPYDRAVLDNALMMGKALREVRQGSAVQHAMETLAGAVVGVPAAAPQRRRLRRRFGRRRTVVWNGRPSGLPVKYCPYTVAAAGRDRGRGDLLPIVRGEAHRGGHR
jgi:MinD-like ATPase involved in chromosome partitioning or flagellar assembly